MTTLSPSSHGAVAALLIGLTALACAAEQPGPDAWPTLHRDYQRSGYTPHVVEGPYERKWFRDFHAEMIATRVEAIVAEGKVYVGTFAGNLYALNVEDGSTAWTYRADGAIGASACYRDGKLYVGDDAGVLHCISAADGEPIWRYDAGAGLWASPACDGDTVYIGDRAGVFHAVHVADGSGKWTHETGRMILASASLSPDGRRIVVGSDDMHVYCLSPDGELFWKSPKLAGLSLRDHAPTIWQGLAIVRTNPADGFHEVMGRQGELLEQIQRGIPLGEGERVLFERSGEYLVTPSPQRRQAEHRGVVEYLRERPYEQTFYAFDLETGQQPWIAPVFYTGGLHNPATAPTFNPETGELYTLYRTSMTNYLRGVRRYSAFGRMDRQTGRITFSWPEPQHEFRENNWRGFPMIGDETQALSLMGDWIISTHQGDLGAVNLETLQVKRIWPGRDTFGGIFGPGNFGGKFNEAREMARQGYLTGVSNEWHGPDRSIVAIASDRIFWVVGSQVVCIGGPDTPTTDTGGTDAPPLIRNRLRWRHAHLGGQDPQTSFDRDLPVQPVSTEQMLRWIRNAPAEPEGVDTELAQHIRATLDAEVRELIDQRPGWAPLVVQLGISGEDRYFWRTSETMQILALALPHLSAEVRSDARAYLDMMFRAGVPYDAPVFAGSNLARREPYELGPEMEAFAAGAPRYQPDIEDLYAVWAYAHYGDAWADVLARTDQYREVFEQYVSEPFDFEHTDVDPDDNKGRDRGRDLAEHLNARIAGVLAYGRIMARAGEQAQVRRAGERLAEMVAARVHHERADQWFVRQTKVAANNLHQQKIPRYVALTPELSEMLRRFAREPLENNVSLLTAQLPVWYHAYGERMIGGENYISPPHLSRGLFAILADGVWADPQTLVARLDQPWCAADVYYIEKLTAVLRAFDRQSSDLE